MRAISDTNRRADSPALLVIEGGIEGLKFHPIANTFPLMEGDAFRELVEDVRKNGQQHDHLLKSLHLAAADLADLGEGPHGRIPIT